MLTLPPRWLLAELGPDDTLDLQAQTNARTRYVGTPRFVFCATNPVCPAGCN